MQSTFRIHKIMAALLFLSAVCMAVENPNVSGSFKANSNVPSQGQSQRLLTNPNASSAGGNDVVTGNVSGMRYFHGVVPYGSSYYSSANLSDSGTSSLTSFLRRSTNSVISDRNPGQTRAYYEPRQAVSSYYVQNGKPTALSESIASGKFLGNPYTLPTLSQKISTENLQRPLSTNSLELEQLLTRQFELKEAAKNKVLQDDSQFKDFFETVLKPEEWEKQKQDIEPEEKQETLKNPELEIFEKFQKERQEAIIEEAAAREDTLKEEEEDGEDTSKDGHSKDGHSYEERTASHAEAESIRGKHQTFSGLAEAKFADYMKVAEEFMREGKFYKAADAYSLAAIWMSKDARPYAGQAFALFAAGEYMSSAYYLSRAVTIDPELAAKKYDLAALIGDRDTIENRLVEITTWQDRSDSGELAFLMAYVLYHDGKVLKATTAIDKAEEKMPDSPAVAILKNVITPKNETNP